MDDIIKYPFKRNLKTYRNYVCPYCFNQINKCSCKLYPPYTLILIDLGMQEIVRILNAKGYKTLYSCESHYTYSFAIYIRFVKDYKFKEIPEGFKKSDSSTIEHIIKKRNNEKDFNDEKQKYLDILLKWAESLA